MGKRKHKKATDFQEEMIKSVFLTGKPNIEKRNQLMYIQSVYTDEVNRFIQLLDQSEEMFPYIVRNAHQAPEVRAFEKANRSGVLTSAYSQSAFDMAMDHLYNRMTDIRHDLSNTTSYGFIQASPVFTMVIQGASFPEIKDFVEKNCSGQAETVEFYQKVKAELSTITDYDTVRTEIMTWYSFLLEEYKVPFVKRASVRLTSKLYTLEKSTDIKAPYVISVTNPLEARKRIPVPLSVSADAKRRLMQYERGMSVSYSVKRGGVLEVTVAFKKHHPTPDVKDYRGVDVGILDMLHTSDDQAFGTFQNCENFYKNTVEPAFAIMNTIRNKKRRIRHFLRKHKQNLSEEQIKCLRDKMDRMDKMLREMKMPYHKRNAYRNMQQHEIKKAVDDYISTLPEDRSVCTVLELLDIKDFKKSKDQNQKLSNFARADLSKKLIETLNWNGHTYLQVDPAYTSQVCPVCSNLDKANRDGKRFACTCCGYEDDADHVGGLNIKARATDKEVLDICKQYQYRKQKRHQKLKDLYTKRNQAFLQNLAA